MLKTMLRSLFQGNKEALDDALGRARALHKAGEPRQALSAYQSALERGAPEHEVRLQMGVLYSSLGEHGRAIEQVERVVALAPGDADAWCMLGTLLADALRFDAAQSALERALALRADFSEAHF